MEESLLNFSRAEEDPFAKIPMQAPNVSEPIFYHPSTISIIVNYLFFGAEILNFFLAIASVISDVLIIYFIFRYKRLKKNLNLYIANYAIMNLCYYVIAPILLIAHLLFSLGFSYFAHLYCYISMMETTFLTCSFLFTTLLGLDWTFSCVDTSLFKGNILKYKYLILYIFIFVVMLSSVLGCVFQYEISQFLLFFFFMPLVVISLGYTHHVRRKRVLNSEHLKTEYALWIFTIAVGLFVPIYILDIIITLFSHSFSSFTIIAFIIEYILTLLSTPIPVFILHYLIKWNKHFKMAFDTTFKRSVRTYGSDNLDDASDNEEIVEDGGSKNVQNDANGLSRPEILVP